MPHLRTLKCSHVLPRWEFNDTPAPPLKSLKVELHSDSYYCGLRAPLKPLKQLLRNTLSLEEMELMIPFFLPAEDENNVPAFANTILTVHIAQDAHSYHTIFQCISSERLSRNISPSSSHDRLHPFTSSSNRDHQYSTVG